MIHYLPDNDPTLDDLHEFLVQRRAEITLLTPCAGCGKTMKDEFYDGLFDGVLNDAGDPFHHGCEDF